MNKALYRALPAIIIMAGGLAAQAATLHELYGTYSLASLAEDQPEHRRLAQRRRRANAHDDRRGHCGRQCGGHDPDQG